MRKIFAFGVALVASCALIAPAAAITITARVSGGPIPIYSAPGDRNPIVGVVADGQEIPIDRCTFTDRDSQDSGRSNSFPNLYNRTQFCQIPGYGWVKRSYIVGRGLVNVTPPDFNGAGW